MKAIGNRRPGAAGSNYDFQVANLHVPVFKKLNNNERQTVLRKGH
jgi:hypothetical protein